MTQLFSRADLHEHGLTTDRAINESLASGQLVRLQHGLYALAVEGQSIQLQSRALLRRLGPDAVISHLAAAVAHDLPFPLWMFDRVRATRPVPTGQKLKGAGFYPCPLAPQDVVEIDGIPVTSLERTVIDVARIVPPQWGLAPVDVALCRGLTRAQLVEVIDRGKRRPGNRNARWAVSLGDARSESPGESRSRAIMAKYGLPSPSLQTEIRDPFGNFVARVDFLWESAGVIGEFDGEAKYALDALGPDHAHERERERQSRLEQLGYRVVRWTWRDLASPEALAHKLDRAMAGRIGMWPDLAPPRAVPSWAA